MVSKKVIFIFAIVVYLLSSFAAYSYFAKNSVNTSAYKKPVIDANGEVVDNDPKTEECPLNGQMFSKNQKAAWEKRRPLGIMVQNNIEARPQSGVSTADVVYEAVAEGGITRFLLVYYCQNPKIVGSVRSARTHFLNIIQEYGNYPLYAHVGGANCDRTTGSGCANGAPADALGQLEDLEWAGYNNLNQFSVPFPIFWRDPDRLPGRATEHTVYTDTNKLWDYAASKRKLTNVDEDGQSWDEGFEPWEFVDDAKEAARGAVAKVDFGFWDDNLGSDYTVTWQYDKASNSYKRVNGGEPHIDKNNNKQIMAKNIVVVFSEESPANDGYIGGQHLLYDLEGEGDAIIFQNGKATKGSWNKEEPAGRMTFTNAAGENVPFVRGQIFIEILPEGNKVTY